MQSIVVATCMPLQLPSSFFFNDTATTEIYTLSLHDALPISLPPQQGGGDNEDQESEGLLVGPDVSWFRPVLCHLRSEEHTSELQSHSDLVCRLLLEKKKAA